MSISLSGDCLPGGSDAIIVPGSAAAPQRDVAEAIREAVQTALRNTLAKPARTERRRVKRHPFPYPINVTPVDRGGLLQRELGFSVLGKHISTQGLDFYHTEPVPYRRVVVSLPGDDKERVALVLDLGWCRFGVHGYYENGGRFSSSLLCPSTRPGANRLSDLRA